MPEKHVTSNSACRRKWYTKYVDKTEWRWALWRYVIPHLFLRPNIISVFQQFQQTGSQYVNYTNSSTHWKPPQIWEWVWSSVRARAARGGTASARRPQCWARAPPGRPAGLGCTGPSGAAPWTWPPRSGRSPHNVGLKGNIVYVVMFTQQQMHLGLHPRDPVDTLTM